MSARRTGIAWTEATWNPVTGCDRVSPGCDHCYAATMARRLNAMGQPRYQTNGRPETSGPGFGVSVHPEAIGDPLRWRKPRHVFVGSMTDLFHPKVPDETIAQIFAVMAATPQHTYQVLTKRSARMRSLLRSKDWRHKLIVAAANLRTGLVEPRLARGLPVTWLLPNVWVGVSVEDQASANRRIPDLLATPAAVRWVSAEPLLGPVDLKRIPFPRWATNHWMPAFARLDWVVVGGESGPGARVMEEGWARDLRDQCADSRVAFFFKQPGSVLARLWGCRAPGHDPDEWPETWPREYPGEAAP